MSALPEIFSRTSVSQPWKSEEAFLPRLIIPRRNVKGVWDLFKVNISIIQRWIFKKMSDTSFQVLAISIAFLCVYCYLAYIFHYFTSMSICLSSSILGLLMIQSWNICYIWCWKSGRWNCQSWWFLSTGASRASRCPPNLRRSSAKVWSKLQRQQEHG